MAQLGVDDLRAHLEPELEVEEGRRRFPYFDTRRKISIGVGRNLTDVGLSEDEVDYLFNNDYERVINDLNKWLPWWHGENLARQLVLADLCFNLGGESLSTFGTFLGLFQQGDFDAAADDLLNTKWAKQVQPSRVTRLVTMLRTGEVDG